MAAAWLPGKRIGHLLHHGGSTPLVSLHPLVEYNGQVAVGSEFSPFRLPFRIGGSHEGGAKIPGEERGSYCMHYRCEVPVREGE